MTQEQADKIIDAVMNCRNTARDTVMPDLGADPRAVVAVDRDAFQNVLNLIHGAVS